MDSPEIALQLRCVARIFAIAIALTFAAACDDSLTPPACERCGEMQIRTERSEYRPGAIVRFTMTNLTGSPLRYDWCSMALASRSTETDFEAVYRPTRQCGSDAGPEEVLTNMKIIRPGEARIDSLVVTVAFQGQQRVHVWLLDTEGRPETVNPAASNVFLVFPGASARLSEAARPGSSPVSRP